MLQGGGLVTGLLDLLGDLLRAFLVDIGGDDLHAVRPEIQRDRLSDAGAGTGDQRNLTLESCVISHVQV